MLKWAVLPACHSGCGLQLDKLHAEHITPLAQNHIIRAGFLDAELGELGGPCRQSSLCCYKLRPGLESLHLSNRIKQYAGRVDAALGEVGVSVPPEPSLMPTLDLAALLRGGPKCSVTCNGKPAWFGGKVSAASVPVGGVISQDACAATCCKIYYFGHGAVRELPHHVLFWPWCGTRTTAPCIILAMVRYENYRTMAMVRKFS